MITFGRTQDLIYEGLLFGGSEVLPVWLRHLSVTICHVRGAIGWILALQLASTAQHMSWGFENFSFWQGRPL